MAQRVHDLAVHLLERYDGDAARVWTDAADAQQLRANLLALPGFGPMKIKSLGSVLAKQFGVEAARELVPWHPTLGDIDSPTGLAEYQAAKRIHKKEWMSAAGAAAAAGSGGDSQRGRRRRRLEAAAGRAGDDAGDEAPGVRGAHDVRRRGALLARHAALAEAVGVEREAQPLGFAQPRRRCAGERRADARLAGQDRGRAAGDGPQQRRRRGQEAAVPSSSARVPARGAAARSRSGATSVTGSA